MATMKRSTRTNPATEEIEDLRMLIRAVTAERNERADRLADLQAQLEAASARVR